MTDINDGENDMTIQGLIKMKCCIVLAALGISGLLSLTHSTINAGISETIAIIYGIALTMLMCIACYDRCINRGCEEQADNTTATGN